MSAVALALARFVACLGAVVTTAVTVNGCASVIEGRSQHISINTSPSGARCGFYREGGIRIATIERTPGDALVEKTKTDILIVCVKPGYQLAALRNHSGISGASFVNIIGGIFTLGISTVIGVAVDSSNGSDNRYESPVNLTMIANEPDQVAGTIRLPDTYTGGAAGHTSQQQSAPASDAEAIVPESSEGQVAATASTPARAAGTLPAAGTWMCRLMNGRGGYTLQFVVAADHPIVLTSYANVPATIIKNDPLTISAINPRGSRPMTITWNADNTMSVTGPSISNPATAFHDYGTCAKS